MPFPALTLLDSFKRFENPLSNGGKWGKPFLANKIGEAAELWRSANLFEEGEDSAYWTPAAFANPAIAVTLVHLPEGSGRLLQLWVCLSEPTTAKISGYRARFVENGFTTHEATVVIEKIVEGIATTLATITNVPWAVGQKIGLQVTGGKVIAWKEAAGIWSVIGEGASSTFTTGFVGIGAQGTEGKVQNAEAGESVAAHEHTLSASQSSVARLGTGRLTPLEPASIVRGAELTQIVIRPDGRFAYVAERASGEIGVFKFGPLGVLEAVETVLQPNVYALCVSADSANLYAVTLPAVGTGQVSAFAINAETGKLTVLTAESDESLHSIAVSSSGKFVAVARHLAKEVLMYTRNLANGKITAVHNVHVEDSPVCVCFTPGGSYLLVLGESGIKVYAVNEAAELALVETLAVENGRSVTTAPGGDFAYVFAEHAEKSIYQFKLDKVTGKLTPLAPATVACGAPAHFGIVSPDSANLYATVGEIGTGGSVFEFAVNGGVIEGFKPGALSAGQLPWGIAMVPTNVYAATKGDHAIYQFRRNVENEVEHRHALAVTQPNAIAMTRAVARHLSTSQSQHVSLAGPPIVGTVDLLPMVV